MTTDNTAKGPAAKENPAEGQPGEKSGTAAILPNKASEDDPRRWGDGPDDDHDAWLKEQKPPHWG